MNTEGETLDAVTRVLSDYSAQESLLQGKLAYLQSRREKFCEKKRISIPLNFETYQEAANTRELALKRNKSLKKDLDASMGKLRSKRCFSPAEDNLRRMINKYSEKLCRVRVNPNVISKMSAQALDYSFRGITYMPDIRDTRPRKGVKPYKRSSAGRFWCSSFRLNNNNIRTVQGITDIVYQMFQVPENLTWLDLSFNKLTFLTPELSELNNLKIIYLHGNCFSQFKSVLPYLRTLGKLYSLTLHGNPIEERRGYRQRILSVLPRLKNLDFTNVTSSDLINGEQGQSNR